MLQLNENNYLLQFVYYRYNVSAGLHYKKKGMKSMIFKAILQVLSKIFIRLIVKQNGIVHTIVFLNKS